MLPVSDHLLLAEDDADFALLFRTAFECAHIPVSIRVVSDGTQAIDYLAGKGDFADRAAHPLPGLVLLDLRLPRLNGFEVLRWIRRQPQLRKVRVAVLTGTHVASDAVQARELGAQDFLVKPFQFLELMALAKTVDDLRPRPRRRQASLVGV